MSGTPGGPGQRLGSSAGAPGGMGGMGGGMAGRPVAARPRRPDELDATHHLSSAGSDRQRPRAERAAAPAAAWRPLPWDAPGGGPPPATSRLPATSRPASFAPISSSSSSGTRTRPPTTCVRRRSIATPESSGQGGGIRGMSGMGGGMEGAASRVAAARGPRGGRGRPNVRSPAGAGPRVVLPGAAGLPPPGTLTLTRVIIR